MGETKTRKPADGAGEEEALPSATTLDARPKDLWPCGWQRARRERWTRGAILDDDDWFEDALKFALGTGLVALSMWFFLFRPIVPPEPFPWATVAFVLIVFALGACLDIYWVYDTEGERLLRIVSLGPLDQINRTIRKRDLAAIRLLVIKGLTTTKRGSYPYELAEVELELENERKITLIRRRSDVSATAIEGERLAAAMDLELERPPVKDLGEGFVDPHDGFSVLAFLVGVGAYLAWFLLATGVEHVLSAPRRERPPARQLRQLPARSLREGFPRRTR